MADSRQAQARRRIAVHHQILFKPVVLLVGGHVTQLRHGLHLGHQPRNPRRQGPWGRRPPGCTDIACGLRGLPQ